jgi:hypothetical protein
VTRSRIAAVDFPLDCDYSQTFFANYSDTVMNGFENGTQVGISWHLVACMPGSQPLRPTYCADGPKHISEQLYLNISAWNPPTTDDLAPEEWSGLFKVTLNTTSGYFELPNIMNNQLPGQLLLGDPGDLCDRDCILQGNDGPHLIE